MHIDRWMFTWTHTSHAFDFYSSVRYMLLISVLSCSLVHTCIFSMISTLFCNLSFLYDHGSIKLKVCVFWLMQMTHSNLAVDGCHYSHEYKGVNYCVLIKRLPTVVTEIRIYRSSVEIFPSPNLLIHQQSRTFMEHTFMEQTSYLGWGVGGCFADNSMNLQDLFI